MGQRCPNFSHPLPKTRTISARMVWSTRAMDHFDVPQSFRWMQVLSDLRGAAIAGFDELASCISDGRTQDLRHLVFEKECKLSSETAKVLHGELMMVASAPDEDHTAFVAATVILVADRLQHGAGDDDLFWNWNAFRDRYREAPSPTRAALMNGFRCAHDMGLVQLTSPPGGRDLCTYDEDDLLRLLKIIARSVTLEAREHMYDLAAAETKGVHRKALENCLSNSCVLSEFGGWFPCEIVEKASLDTENPAYHASTALLLIDAIATRDAKGTMAARYEEQAEEYFMMRRDVRVPMVAALRLLHEMDGQWEPYASWAPETRANKAIVVPFTRP